MLPKLIDRVALRLKLAKPGEDGELVYKHPDIALFVEQVLTEWEWGLKLNSFPIAPTCGRVVVRPAIRPDTTRSGSLFIPEAARETNQEGVVLGVGGEIYDIYPGDRVLFTKHTGVVLDYQSQEIRVLDYEHIVARMGVDDDENIED